MVHQQTKSKGLLSQIKAEAVTSPSNSCRIVNILLVINGVDDLLTW